MQGKLEESDHVFTALPRWTLPGSTADGVVTHREAWRADHVGDAAKAAGVDSATVLLALHARVLATVTSEHDLITGLRDGRGVSARALTVSDGTWRTLVDHAAAAPEVPGAPYEIVLDLSEEDSAADVPEGIVLRVAPRAGELALTYREDAVDGDYIRRLAGYYRAALDSLAAGLDTAHHRVGFLTENELQVQLHGLAGERKPLPRQLFVELFEEQVRLRPDDLAAAHGAETWTYAELNERANRIAHGLLRRGLGAEQVVAVVMERNLNWVAATLAVFKAGGVYLPVRPQFPADRIGTQLDRSSCRFALSEAGSTDTLIPALAGLSHPCPLLHIAELDAEDGPSTDPALPIGPDQLAYIYFTSGSTGAPKGAMCEHAGMLNHLYAKVDDTGLGAGDVVTQTASQCFDISLWQVITPLLVGGSTRIVDTDVQLDVARFIEEVVTARVRVAQLVPSYFEVFLTELEQHPRDLGALRTISVTGEALKYELVQRWFARYPDISLINAYGATEVSDDTMHEVLTGLPDRDFVTVGRSLRNVNTYIVDEHLRLVPLGSPGEIAFSGVAVGRGYINDEERTRQAFVSDPYRPDTRMYRTGDFGRWLPEGRIEFLGRRDQQVKIRGFRIEIGEIENKLLAMPEVRDAAVVIDDTGGGNKNLVAFFCGPDTVTAERVRDHLAAALPDYMVPTYLHRLAALPLTENGKVDKKALVRLAGPLGHAGGTYVAPGTPTERRLATAWAEALGVPEERIGRGDDFFRLGGTSLAAVRLVVKLDRLVSLAQLVNTPVLGELAALIDGGDEGAETGELLQKLAGAPGAVATLVCFPYAGGNAVNFQMPAKELERDGIAVYAVELPGHDFSGDARTMAEVTEVAERVRAEIQARVTTPVMLWGHCAGAAIAIETARLLEADGTGPLRVFVAATLLDDDDRLREEIAEVSALDDREITTQLLGDSAYIELDGLKPERTELVGSAYRHDVCAANRYLLDPGDFRLGCGLDVVYAADDPSTKGFAERLGDWRKFAEEVRLHELGDGGHYFIRTRPADVAALVLAATQAAR